MVTFIFCNFFTNVFAQKDNPLNDLNTILKDFKEVVGTGVNASGFQVESYKNIEPNLAWRVIQEKNQYMKPGEFLAHPVGWYKINDKVLVLLSSDGKIGEVISHFVKIQTFNPKTGKQIAKMVNVAAFGGTAGSSCKIDISEDKKIWSFYTVSTITGSVDEVKLEITDKGDIKEPKKKK